MPVKILSAAIQGIEATCIHVEVDSTPGIYSFNLVGLPDAAVKESQDRIASAIKNSGFSAPNTKNKRIIVNLAPADIKKEGPAYDLPIALGFLLETGQIKFDTKKYLFAGELSLDGSIRHISGALAMTIMAKNKGLEEVILPQENVKEASVVNGVRIVGARTLGEVINHIGRIHIIDPAQNQPLAGQISSGEAFIMIQGQAYAKRALTVAAAGCHNILMAGAPGSGKTLLARALSELLPPLSVTEALEVAKIYSSVGLIKDSKITSERPFRSPHHTTSSVAIVGGGAYPKPGEISLAHRGVLFLDELPEFPRNVLESLRQPLEDGLVTVSRASGKITLPAKFMFVAAMNPCPCGNFGDGRAECICSPINILKYKKKISGPLLDRIDIQVNVSRETIAQEKPNLSHNKAIFKDITSQIATARARQDKRFEGTKLFSNAEMGYKNIDNFCSIDPGAEKLLKTAVNTKNLSLRTYHKMIKVARTIADLEGSEYIQEHHMAEGISLRLNDSLFSSLA